MYLGIFVNETESESESESIFLLLYFVIVSGKLQLVVFVLAVSGPVHAVGCESVSQANEVLFFGSPNALAFVVYL